ncbi:MAG TPA: hypothetical protein VEZ70_03105 [Allosphingosinicella sp.]|nr:hypothetical protein [Allosphingosinicella sp.]
MSAHTYSSDFYDYIDSGSSISAQVVSRIMLDAVRIDSLLDVGGGHGAWAREWMGAGVRDVLCLDGDYVRQEQLVVPADTFQSRDLSKPFDLCRRYDLVQSLEVAEHIAKEDADTFVDNLTLHGDVVLFSAAVPNQGGEHHVNEQPPEYWRRKFAARGYDAYDALRPALEPHVEVKPWYRFNSFIYANPQGSARLSAVVKEKRVPDDVELTIGGDLAWALRRAAVSWIPTGLVKPIAMLKASAEARLKNPLAQGRTQAGGDIFS